MIRYSCDLCKRDLDAEDDLRYVVKMEIFAAMNASEEDDDHDPLERIEDILERQEDASDEAIGQDICQQLRFDLCPECRANSSSTRWAGKSSPRRSSGSARIDAVAHGGLPREASG